jgi:hypothetical protein
MYVMCIGCHRAHQDQPTDPWDITVAGLSELFLLSSVVFFYPFLHEDQKVIQVDHIVSPELGSTLAFLPSVAYNIQ